jgi:serine/threonine protein kinase
MTIVINPKYSHLRSFIENIPDKFDKEGEMVYEARNQLKKFSVEGYDVIVKRYKKPHYINRIAYSFVRPSKAKRAYEFALKLLELGLDSPEPIAFIEETTGGLLDRGYFISIYEKDYTDIRQLMLGNEKNAALLAALSNYIVGIHDKGVLHLDMSPGNILYKKIGDKYCFTLIDINRMQFRPSISTEKRYSSFKRISSNEEVLTEMAKVYAAAANLDETESIREINRFSYEFFNSRKIRNRK